MKMKLDCIPCLLRQSIEAVRRVSDDDYFQKHVIENILQTIANSDLAKSPPALAQIIHRRIREMSGIPDPYKKVKEEFNTLAQIMLDELTAQINRSPYPLRTAVKLAVAGNVIDSGPKTGLSEIGIKNSIASVFSELFEGNIDDFCKGALGAEKILYLADNAGEIFFDRLLIEKMDHPGITLAVRGSPVLNDATMEDALAAGIDQFAEIIGNGSDAPGTILEECSEEFVKYYNEADLVISKGQGNYETLCNENKNIYFLFKIKCRFAADRAGLPVGSNAVIHSAQY